MEHKKKFRWVAKSKNNQWDEFTLSEVSSFKVKKPYYRTKISLTFFRTEQNDKTAAMINNFYNYSDYEYDFEIKLLDGEGNTLEIFSFQGMKIYAFELKGLAYHSGEPQKVEFFFKGGTWKIGS